MITQAHDLSLDEVAPDGVGGGLQAVGVVGRRIQGGNGLFDGLAETAQGIGAFAGQFGFEGAVQAFGDAGAGQGLGKAQGHAPL